MPLLPILAVTDNSLLYLIPLVVGVSLVHCASRYEMAHRILMRTLRTSFKIVGCMTLALVLLVVFQV